MFSFWKPACTPICEIQIFEAAGRCYREFGARNFVVGAYGDFDAMAGSAVLQLKEIYRDITLLRLIPYHPYERPVELSPGWDGTYYPEGMETVPPRYAIVRASDYMARHCDCAVCYAQHIGNSRNVLQKVLSRKIPVIQL